MALNDPPPASAGRRPAASPRDSDAASFVGGERLPCGRLVSEVWAEARADSAPADPHTAGCAFCRQALEGLAALDRATRALRAERLSARTVADRVIQAVRSEARLGRMLPLDDPAGDLRIGATAAAKVLRRAADRIPGVRAGSCRLTAHEDGTAKVSVAMTLSVTLEHPLPERAAMVRRAVVYAAGRELGLAVADIDLKIVSVLRPWKPAPTAGPAPSHRSRS